MSNEEKFKDTVKNLLDEQHFVYDPSNWEIASKNLDNDDKKKRRFLYFLLVGMGLGLLITSRLLFFTEAGKNSTTQTEKETKALSLPLKENKMPALKEDQSAQKDDASDENKNANVRPENALKAIKQPVRFKIKKSGNSGLSDQKGFATLKKKTIATTLANVTIPSDAHVHVAFTKTKKNKQIENKIEEQTTASSIKKDHTEKMSEAAVDSNAGDKIESQSSPLPVVSTQTLEQKEEKPVSKTEFIGDVNNSENKNGVDLVLLKDTLIKDISGIKLQDTISLAAVQPTLQNVAKTNGHCYVEFGGYFNLGWKYLGTREGTGVNPYLGISYLTPLTDKLSFSFGAYYSTLGHLKLDKRTIKSSKIVFGEESDVTSITPITVNYILIPLKLGYNIGPNQSIALGTTIGYLLDVQSEVETYSERLGTQQNNKSYRTGGYVEGFKTFNTQLSLGYRRRLYKNLWMNADVLYGLTDVRDNTFFGMNLKEKMTGLKIGLTYDLLKK